LFNTIRRERKLRKEEKKGRERDAAFYIFPFQTPPSAKRRKK
jgi:hypothetical protein